MRGDGSDRPVAPCSNAFKINEGAVLATDDIAVTGLSGRYARALYELADESGRLDAVAGDLRALENALAESADLRRMVASPVISRVEQERAMMAIMAAMQIGNLVANTVALMAQKRRLFAMRDVIRDYLRILAVRRGETTAEVISARALRDDELSLLRQELRNLIKRDVMLETHVDANLLGGLVVRVGSQMFDSSLRNKLQRLELAMKGIG